MEAAVATMMKAHRARDQEKDPGEDQAMDKARLERLQSEAKRIREFLATHAERRSEKGAIRKSNVTDNDSAKMATSKGVIQGYTAVAAVDCKAQIIVAAQAHGSGSEQSVLLPMVQSTEALRTEQTMVTADAGYHSEENLKHLYESGVPALIADNLMRRRDERFKDQAKYNRATRPAVGQGGQAQAGEVHARGLPVRPADQPLYLPCREQALLDRASLHDERPGTPQVPGGKARLCPLPPQRPLSSPPGAHPDAPGRVLREEPGLAAEVHRADEGGDRQRARTQRSTAGGSRPWSRCSRT